jgi:hypothetical protein
MSRLKERLLQLLVERPGAPTNELHAIISNVHRATIYNALMGLFEEGLLHRERIASGYRWSIVKGQTGETGVGYLARLYAPKFEKLTVVGTRHFREKHSAPGVKHSRIQHGRHSGQS